MHKLFLVLICLTFVVNSGSTADSAPAKSNCVCTNWYPSPTQEWPLMSKRVCGAFPGPGGCIQERHCDSCYVLPDCGDCDETP